LIIYKEAQPTSLFHVLSSIASHQPAFVWSHSRCFQIT
jgi:hypothetical protein